VVISGPPSRSDITKSTMSVCLSVCLSVCAMFCTNARTARTLVSSVEIIWNVGMCIWDVFPSSWDRRIGSLENRDAYFGVFAGPSDERTMDYGR